MRKFVFRLEALRRLTEARERARAVELAASETRRREAETRTRERAAEERGVEARFRAAQATGAVDPRVAAILLRQLADAGTRSRQAADAESRDTDEANAARDRLAEEMRGRKTLDRLRERTQRTFDLESRREDERELDDLATRTRGVDPDRKDRAA